MCQTLAYACWGCAQAAGCVQRHAWVVEKPPTHADRAGVQGGEYSSASAGCAEAVPAVTISDKAFRADQLYFSNTLADCN